MSGMSLALLAYQLVDLHVCSYSFSLSDALVLNLDLRNVD